MTRLTTRATTAARAAIHATTAAADRLRAHLAALAAFTRTCPACGAGRFHKCDPYMPCSLPPGEPDDLDC